MNKTYYIETYGCQMNVSDSELVEKILIDQGYEKSKSIQDADAIFINTCSIREHAEDKVHSQLGRYDIIKQKKPSVLIGVLGCMAQSLKNEILENKPYVDIILGPDAYRRLPDLLNRERMIDNSLVDTKLSRYEVYDDLFPLRDNGINAWISIMRGCDKFCTFCIVPFTRGRERSRSLLSIIKEINKAVEEGYKEVTLLGQNVNSYKYEQYTFPQLLEKIANIPNLERIRYTSPHPQDINDELLQIMSKYDNICNYVHLPLQAGSNKVLKRMNRTYSKEHFLNLTNKIRNILPNVGISTDIIVGFPGESDADFNETLSLMKQVEFDSAFNFKYSVRRGTKASEYEDQVPEEIKKERLQRVINLQKEHTFSRNIKLVGTTQEVLVEKESKMSKNHWAGRTDANKWVIFDKKNVKINDIISVKITEARGITLHGHLIQNLEAA
ncbi:MAG: tRNA (N6-isopentenyl adenosine(37)-C2)-methylthiotransferase MiaB [Candidatus Neomarinimicrobiota bacterium]